MATRARVFRRELARIDCSALPIGASLGPLLIAGYPYGVSAGSAIWRGPNGFAWRQISLTSL